MNKPSSVYLSRQEESLALRDSPRKQFNLYRNLFPNLAYMTYVRELQRALSGCDTILDIGCGGLSPLRFVEAKRLVGVDGWRPNVVEAIKNGTHDVVLEGRAEDLGNILRGEKFEGVTALDVIEHLPKNEGLQFLKTVEKIAQKVVIVLTPNGFLQQRSVNGDLEEHLSGWTPEDMAGLGYTVTGMYGHKSLRGECQNLKGRPRFIWGIASQITHYFYTRRHPESAAALFCIHRSGDD